MSAQLKHPCDSSAQRQVRIDFRVILSVAKCRQKYSNRAKYSQRWWTWMARTLKCPCLLWALPGFVMWKDQGRISWGLKSTGTRYKKLWWVMNAAMRKMRLTQIKARLTLLAKYQIFEHSVSADVASWRPHQQKPTKILLRQFSASLLELQWARYAKAYKSLA